jgi:hypothetical protein
VFTLGNDPQFVGVSDNLESAKELAVDAMLDQGIVAVRTRGIILKERFA